MFGSVEISLKVFNKQYSDTTLLDAIKSFPFLKGFNQRKCLGVACGCCKLCTDVVNIRCETVWVCFETNILLLLNVIKCRKNHRRQIKFYFEQCAVRWNNIKKTNKFESNFGIER